MTAPFRSPGRRSLLTPILVGIALLGLPAGRAARADAVDGLTVSPPAKCLPARQPADPAVPPPKVVSSFPAQGAAVRPGRLIVRITVDLPMACGGSFLDAPPFRSPLPDGDRRVTLTLDRKTFKIIGYVQKSNRYGLQLNRPPIHDFIGLSGQPLEPFTLTFTTSSGPPVVTDAEAMAEDAGAGR